MVRQHTDINISSKSLICAKCQGKYWHPDDQSKTQREVMKNFGIIANNCVNGEGGVVYCPYAKEC